MPVSKAQRWMRGHWSVVLERATEYARSLPPEGVNRGRFIADVLLDVDPRDCPEVVELLGRRGIVWLSTYRGEVTVYAEKPKGGVKRELAGKRPIDSFFADVGPLLLDALDRAEATKLLGSSPEAKEGVRVAIGRIVAVCYRHARKGLPLAEMRTAMWRLLPKQLMHAIVFQEPRLQERSEADAFAVEPERKKRLPRGLTTKEKALAIIRDGGFKGVTKTNLSRRIKPPMTAYALAEVVGELETERLIVWCEARLNGNTRPGIRLFAAEVGLPKLHSDRTMYHREAEPAWSGG